MIVSTRRLFCRLLRTFDIATVCDVGSMDGDDALRFRRALPNAAVLALEPNPRNFALMAEDDRLKRAGIRILPVAASDRRSEAPLFVVDADYAPGRDLARRGMSSLTSERIGLDCRPLSQCRLFVSTSSSCRSRCTPGRLHCGSTLREWRSR